MVLRKKKAEQKKSGRSAAPSAPKKNAPARASNIISQRRSPSLKSSPDKSKLFNPQAEHAIPEPVYFNAGEECFYQPQPMRELPQGYGGNLIHLMVRDPSWVYAYWEIQPEHQHKALAELGGEWNRVRYVIRMYETRPDGSGHSYDTQIDGLINHWYFHVQPNHSYYSEIGLLHEDGRFIVLARSNKITTPRNAMSEILDEEWMGIDFEKMYALSGGFAVGKSSAELTRLMQERLEKSISSGSGAVSISSMSSPVKIPRKRGFWFVLDCELIVYGATEPDAAVTLQGKPVQLRPDGTFTLRFAFPDGKQVLDATARSADGIEERTITPVVERKTKVAEPIIKQVF